jgi:lysophospholipase L1-like esterase
MKILLLGDSHMAYGPWTEYFPDCEFENLAMGGQIAEGVLDRLERTSDEVFHCDKVFVMVGINNLFFDDLFDLKDFISTYKKIIRLWKERAPHAFFYVLSILPVAPEYIPDRTIEDTNRALKKMVEKEGAYFVDLYRIFRQNSDYLNSDGVHLNEKGYHLWSEAIKPLVTG